MSSYSKQIKMKQNRCVFFLVALIFCVARNIQQSMSTETFTVKERLFPTYFEGNSDKIDLVTMKLEALDAKYYVYDNINLTLPEIRTKALASSRLVNGWAKARWARRHWLVAQGEIQFLKTLEQHAHLRTTSQKDAAFTLVPIPIGALAIWGSNENTSKAFEHLFQNEPYHQFPEKHIFLSLIETVFRGDSFALKFFKQHSGLSKVISRIEKSTLVNDVDVISFDYYNQKHKNDFSYSTSEAKPLFHQYWSLGYAHFSSIESFKFADATFDKWKNKTLNFFYHTTPATSMNNSTQYRHALVKDKSIAERLLQPSSIGYDIPYKQWVEEFNDAKFCPLVRGDNPSSTSVYKAIRNGCMPIIVSEVLPYYQPLFSSLLQYKDFGIVVDEKEFLQDPAHTLNFAVESLTPDQVKQKVRGLGLMQRILCLDHPKSLFVQAFIHETIASQQRDYYHFWNYSHLG